MTMKEAEALLRRNIIASIGEARVAELEPLIRSTAEALAVVMNEPIELDQESPDFIRGFP
jgi:hypothetical protein